MRDRDYESDEVKSSIQELDSPLKPEPKDLPRRGREDGTRGCSLIHPIGEAGRSFNRRRTHVSADFCLLILQFSGAETPHQARALRTFPQKRFLRSAALSRTLLTARNSIFSEGGRSPVGAVKRLST